MEFGWVVMVGLRIQEVESENRERRTKCRELLLSSLTQVFYWRLRFLSDKEWTIAYPRNSKNRYDGGLELPVGG